MCAKWASSTWLVDVVNASTEQMGQEKGKENESSQKQVIITNYFSK
jgi:hypothetical protein